MYFAITDYGVKKAFTRQKLNKKLKGLLENAEFEFFGRDAVTKLTNKDIEFIQDKKRMAQIPIQQLYKKDMTKALIFVVMLLQFILLIKG